MAQTIEQLMMQWDSGEGKPYKGSLIDRAAYEANPESPSCMCAQGQVLHYVAGWEIERLKSVDQTKADKAVADFLGISRGHAILLRQINDKVDGAPSIVLTHPEKILGEHAHLVLAFFKYLDSMDRTAWGNYFAAWDAAWDAAGADAWAAAWADARAAAGAAAWDAARAAAWAAARAAAWAAAGAAAWDAARAAAWADARAAAWAVNEIQGHKVLAGEGKPLFFLPLFGFKTIQQLIDWAEQ